MNSRGRTLLSLLAICSATLAVGCDRDGAEVTAAVDDQDRLTLLAAKTDVPPIIDGAVSAGEWDSATPIGGLVEVPAIKAFAGYAGRGYQVELKALYDAENIYFLASWDDASRDFDRETWFFDVDESKWKQESRWGTFASDDDREAGIFSRRPFYEDKLSMIWEATPVTDFHELGCWATCHTGLSPSASAGGKSALKYANRLGEVVDMWHWKSVRNTSQSTMDDQFTDSQRTAKNGGRKSDPGTGAYADNKQTIEEATVPRFVIPDASERYYWVETDGTTPTAQSAGLALRVTAVNENGVLTLEDGSTIDPNADARYQRDGSLLPASVYTRPVAGDRGDWQAVGRYSGGWTLEATRALVTGSSGKDVQWDDLNEMYDFGVAIFDNAAIAHAVSTELLQLRFD